MPEAVNNPSALGSFGNQLGVTFSSAKWYLDWSDDFTPGIARGFKNQGAIPELTWQPQSEGAGISNPDVLAGNYDNYINQFANSVKNFGFPIRITLAPEMNGDWSPWAPGKNGNDAESFKSFWRYTVQKFRNSGANNVSWIWSPNIHSWGEKYSYSELFPGDDFVDFTGLEGYNWGTTQSWSQWQSFSEVFSSSYYDLTGLSSKEILITEMASTEIGGSKPQWIIDMFKNLRGKFSRIRGFTWFNINKETDWRINSSSASMEAFRNAAHGDYGQIQNQAQEQSPKGQNNVSKSLGSKTAENSDKLNISNLTPEQNQKIIKLQKTKKSIMSLTQKKLRAKPLKMVKAASIFKAGYKSYFVKNNFILFKIILEFFLFSIVLMIAFLTDAPKLRIANKQNH